VVDVFPDKTAFGLDGPGDASQDGNEGISYGKGGETKGQVAIQSQLLGGLEDMCCSRRAPSTHECHIEALFA
jgi:hypothetical protein